MSAATKIQWTDRTWNPVRGCSIVSPGCQHCYAMKQAHRFSRKGQPYEGLTRLTSKGPVWTGKIRLVPEALEEPLRWKQPARVFVNSMSDLFHEDVPDDFIIATFGAMFLAPEHTYQILTKRAERMREFLTHADKWAAAPRKNIHLGVSVENQEQADARIPLLLQTPAAVRFVSAEPLLEAVKVRGYLLEGEDPGKCGNCGHGHGFTRCPIGRKCWVGGCKCDGFKRVNFAIDWVIIGGESGSNAREFRLEWAREILTQCRDAAVPAFMKQTGSFAKGYDDLPFQTKDRKGGDPSEWPEDLRVREFPAIGGQR